MSEISREEKRSGRDRDGVNFINILWEAFTVADHKSAKRYWQLDWIFTLLGSLHIKDACKHVGKIDTWCQFHQP